MRLLITGASGYLGRRLTLQAASEHEVFAGYARRRDRIAAGRPVELDLLRPEAAVDALARIRPDAVIHAAAINPGGPEALMDAVNVGGSRRLAAAAAGIGARFVHVSTDVVHDGRNAPYADGAEPTPVGAYPRSKAAAERAVLAALPAAAVVRTSLIYGLDELDHGTRSFAERLRRGAAVRLFADVVRQPIWVESLARALLGRRRGAGSSWQQQQEQRVEGWPKDRAADAAFGTGFYRGGAGPGKPSCRLGFLGAGAGPRISPQRWFLGR